MIDHQRANKYDNDYHSIHIGRGQMNISMNAWLLGKIDDYKFSVRDATVDFYMAEASLRRPECNINHLKRYNNVSLNMANLCLENGDDESYLHALSKLHNRLIVEINNPQRCQLFRVQSYHFARHTLTLICQKYAMEGTWEKANAFQKDFVKRVPFQL
jgi:hypothetical protein